MTPEAVVVLADGWEHRRRSPEAEFFNIYSYDVSEDFIILKADLPVTPMRYSIPVDLAETMRSAKAFELVTRMKSTQKTLIVPINNIIYDTNHQVIQFVCDYKEMGDLYLSGSPLVSCNRDGSHSLLAIVSSSAHHNLHGDLMFACPVNISLAKEIGQ